MVKIRTVTRNVLKIPSRQAKAFIVHTTNVVKFTWTHPANEGGRARALLRVARFQMCARLLRRRTRTRIGERSSLWAGPNRFAALKAVCANPPDYPEMLVWQRALRPMDLFIDVGANVGSYTIWAGDVGAEVIALEPAQDTFALLVENAALNGYTIHAIQAAAGASAGTARFTSGRDDWNHLDAAGGVEVPVVTIDSVIGDRVAAGMKVDVEGFEIEVLRGCERALSGRRIRLIQLEWNSVSQQAVGADRRPVADLLAKYGYSLYRPDLTGVLTPVTDLGFGPDIFARPDG